MPIYTYRCAECGAVDEQFARVSDRDASVPECHGQMQRQLCPSMVSVQADCHAISPIDGTPLTSRRQRAEYMKRHDLVDALPAAEVIAKTNQRKRDMQELAAQLPKLPAHLEKQVYQEAGFPG